MDFHIATLELVGLITNTGRLEAGVLFRPGAALLAQGDDAPRIVARATPAAGAIGFSSREPQDPQNWKPLADLLDGRALPPGFSDPDHLVSVALDAAFSWASIEETRRWRQPRLATDDASIVLTAASALPIDGAARAGAAAGRPAPRRRRAEVKVWI